MADSRPSNGISMTYATSAPATSGGQPGSPVRFALFFLASWWSDGSHVECLQHCSYLIDSINYRQETKY
jgi:hypothetical protein